MQNQNWAASVSASSHIRALPSPSSASAWPRATPRVRTPWLGSVTSTAHRYFSGRFADVFPSSWFSPPKPDTFCSCREDTEGSFGWKRKGTL